MGVERDVRAEGTEGQRHIRSTGDQRAVYSQVVDMSDITATVLL